MDLPSIEFHDLWNGKTSDCQQILNFSRASQVTGRFPEIVWNVSMIGRVEKNGIVCPEPRARHTEERHTDRLQTKHALFCEKHLSQQDLPQ
ncbi:hypothetical protein A6X21_15685 [Planctopirus hydrillae]|uniref:Uncharacterized protein n=1 Tax=Planctopirus hydrillae TaxID=1841610 RepID=A0A1C3ETM2_9PLAN|nr:hypothetical protein A6X21_15685 [Planctopirus hydrillae]